MPKKHTIDTLTTDVDRRFKAVNKRLDVMQPQLSEMHDYIIDQKGYERGALNKHSDGTININKDVWGLIVKLVVVLAAIAGITKLQ